MEKVYLIGTFHNHRDNQKIISESMSLYNPDRIYIEKGGHEDTPYIFNKRINQLDLSTLEIISSLFDCYSMKKYTDLDSKSEFEIARSIANDENIPVSEVDKDRDDILYDMFESQNSKDLFKYIYEQSKNYFKDEERVKSLFRKHALNPSVMEKRNELMVNNIKSLDRKNKTLFVTGAAHVEDLMNKLKSTDNINPIIIWNQYAKEGDRYTREEIKESLLYNTNSLLNNHNSSSSSNKTVKNLSYKN